MAEYKPLFVYLEPASIPQVVAHIQKYLAENPIVSDPEAIAEAIQKYIEEHPEIIAVASVNGKTGNVVLTGSDININASSAVSVETQLLNLASMINNTGADITQIQANISQIYTDIETIQNDVETNTSNISALQTSVEGQGTRLNTAEGNISSLQTSAEGQGARLNTAEGNISSIQTSVQDNTTDIAKNADDIEALDTRVTTLEGAVTSGLKLFCQDYTIASIASGSTKSITLNFSNPVSWIDIMVYATVQSRECFTNIVPASPTQAIVVIRNLASTSASQVIVRVYVISADTIEFTLS